MTCFGSKDENSLLSEDGTLEMRTKNFQLVNEDLIKKKKCKKQNKAEFLDRQQVNRKKKWEWWKIINSA